MRHGILLMAVFLFICSGLSLPPVFAEENAGQVKAVEAKPAEKSAPVKTEQPKADAKPEEKKAEPKAVESEAVKPEAKKPEAKTAEKKPEEKKAEPEAVKPEAENSEAKPKPAEKKADAKPEEKTEPKTVEPEAKKPETKPAEKKPEEKKAEKKPEPAENEKWKERLQKKHEVFLEWFEENYSDEYQELIKNRDSQPDQFVQRIGESMKVYGPILREEKRNPELAKALKEDLRLVAQRDKLVCDIRKAKPEQQKAMFEQLQGVVAARFDIIIHKKQLQYDHIRKRLEDLNKLLEKQAAELQKLRSEKDAKVEQRMNELIDPKERLNWK